MRICEPKKLQHVPQNFAGNEAESGDNSMSLEVKAKTLNQIVIDKEFAVNDPKWNMRYVRLEDAQKEIQKTEKKLEDLHSDFISQSEAWQKTIDKNKVLEGRLALIRSLIKKFPDEGYDLVDLLDKQKKWLGRLEKELKT